MNFAEVPGRGSGAEIAGVAEIGSEWPEPGRQKNRRLLPRNH